MMEKIRYTLENLDCAGCAAKAEAAVNKAPWIEKATVDFMNKRLTVHQPQRRRGYSAYR